MWRKAFKKSKSQKVLYELDLLISWGVGFICTDVLCGEIKSLNSDDDSLRSRRVLVGRW